MNPSRFQLLPLALALAMAVQPAHGDSRIHVLEERLEEIDNQLEGLANFSMQTSVGAIGFRSHPQTYNDQVEWIQIDLEKEQEIDLVVLVPAIWRQPGAGFIADGFPLDFEILAGSEKHPEGLRIARFTSEDALLPRIAPVTIPCAGTRAKWIKLVATRLTPRAWDDAYVLQLSEIMVFSDQENLALRKTVTTSSDGVEKDFGARRKAFLVDGSLPFLMNARTGKPSPAYLAQLLDDTTASFSIDLGSPLPVNRLHLHTLEVTDTVPQANRADFGTPHRVRLEGAKQPDFSDSVTLCTYEKQSIYDVSSIIQLSFPEHHCQHLRLIIDEPDHPLPFEFESEDDFFGFAEIEIFSKGTNILLNKLLKREFIPLAAERPLPDLTDGRNIFGDILPIRSWMEQLALRHDLEAERPIVTKELNQLYAGQRKHLELLKTLSIILAAGILILILVSRMRSMRAVDRLQKRFAADLHDEIGANLHAVGLLSDIAAEQSASQSENTGLADTVTEIRAVTDRTADAVRYLSDSQNPRRPLGTLEEDMHRIAARMMDDTTYEISVEGARHLDRLSARQRADLFLFYKECLVNISRHSGATHFTADVKANSKDLTMVIEDNGDGLDDNTTPASLQRRARILRASLDVKSPPSPDRSGTLIHLQLRFRRFLFLP